MTVAAIFNMAAMLVVLAALFGYLNHRWLQLPDTIGLLIIALSVSFTITVADAVFPALGIDAAVRGAVDDLAFGDTLLKAGLSFLLFAGALHVDLGTLARGRWGIMTLSTTGVIVSTAIVGGLMFFGFRAFGFPIPFSYCLVFGALISPTDPVAVLDILKRVKVPKALEVKIAGESLFNDGVGVVLFTVLIAFASGQAVTLGGTIELLALEVAGGLALGLAAGYAANRALYAIDDHNLAVLITLGLVMGTYALASGLHLSGPLAMVVAGLLIGNFGRRFAMSKRTRKDVDTFWSLVDRLLNSLLFLAIGFQSLAIDIAGPLVGASLVAIPVVLAARFIAVSLPVTLFALRHEFSKGAFSVLTWGGLRGGISVALALTLPPSPEKPVLLAVTYVVVIFSIVVQGLTVEKVVRAAVTR